MKLTFGPLCLLLATLLAALATTGCNRETAPVENISAASAERIFTRLTGPSSTLASPGQTIDLDAPWFTENAESARTPEGLDITLDEGGVIGQQLALDAARFTELELRLADVSLDTLYLWWSEAPLAMEQLQERSNRIVIPLTRDHAAKAYIVPLDVLSGQEWRGKTTYLAFGSDQAGTFRLVGAQFLSRTPASRIYKRFGTVTMEALEPGQHVVRTRLGAHPRLVFSAAMDGATSRAARPAQFQIRIATEQQNDPPLAERQFQVPEQANEWARYSASLEEFSGKEVTLTFIPPDDAEIHLWWGAPTIESDAPNGDGVIPIILISCDTMRADHLSCYGYERDTTPFLTRWARDEAVLFEDASAEEAYTLPSHMTMLTGLFTQHHLTGTRTALRDEVVTLQELLQDEGYSTAGFVGHAFNLNPEHGFRQGFDWYDSPDGVFRHWNQTEKRLRTWLGEQPAHRMFLFFHNYDIHAKVPQDGYSLPYDPDAEEFLRFSKPLLAQKPFDAIFAQGRKAADILEAHLEGELDLSAEQEEVLIALYDDCIRFVDHQIEQFLEYLKAEGLYDNALIVVTSDHGETLGERNHFGHWTVYEEVTRVPLLVKFPRGEFAGHRFPGQVQLTDLYPTVQDVLDLPPSPVTDGRSLLAMLENRTSSRRHVFSRLGFNRSIRENAWKLHWNLRPAPAHGEYELYNLQGDKSEFNNLWPGDVDIAQPLAEEIAAFYSSYSPGFYCQAWRGAGDWSATVTLRFEEPIERVFRYRNWGNLEALDLAPDQREIVLQFGQEDHQEYAFPQLPPDASFEVDVQASVPVRLWLGDEPEDGVTDFARNISMTGQPLSRPGHLPETESPQVLLWYVTGHLEDSPAAPEVPEELEDQLRSLGYIE